MKNVVFCFLTVLMFAPSVALSAGASRSTVLNATNTTESERSASSLVRTSARSVTRSDAVRSEKSATRNADVVLRKNRVDSNSGTGVRNTKTNSVVSRNQLQQRELPVVKPRVRVLGAGSTNSTNSTNENNRNNNVEHGVADRAAAKNKETKISAQDVSNAKELLEQTAALNKSCQEQYNECMDQFCAVVDANQKRCSCSSHLSNYAEVQKAVTSANNELNEVAQRIRYVGLSADEIRAIMTETEAEAELDKNKDKSETRSMLSKIEDLIKDPTTKIDTVSDSDFGLDLDLDFSDDGADMFSLDFLNGNGDNISSKRGAALYNAAKKRCKTILNNCTDVGATSDQITGNYDLAIDKDCIAYEQGLTKMNETLKSNVRSAGLMLQKARLAVLQNKNQYDPKGCVSALETCMTDDMVCGDNYAKCLDPTKRYIDENGNVVLGQDITNITDFMENFNSGEINETKLSAAQAVSLDVATCKSAGNDDGACVMKYLLTKIGTGATVKEGGLCRAVLDKCQYYTYGKSGDKYNPYNEIVVNYMQRAMVNIKSAQQQIISDYASSCMTELASCYNQQVTQVNAWSSNASVASVKSVMTGACRNVALTCAYAVFANMCSPDSGNLTDWVLHAVGDSTHTASDPTNQCTPCDSSHQSECIEGISEIFYQSLLCPDNSTYVSGGTVSPNRTILQGFANASCRCNDGYTVWGGACLPTCSGTDAYRNDYGACTTCASGTTASGGDGITTENSECVSSSN